MVSVRTRPLLIALVAILAIALAAATLNTAVDHGGAAGPRGGGTFAGDADRSTSDDDPGDIIGFVGLEGAFPVIPLPCYPVLNELRFFVSFALVAGVILYGLYRWKGALVPYAVVAGLAPPGLLIHALLTACREAEEVRLSLPLGARSANATGQVGLSGGSGAGATPVVSVVIVGGLLLVLLLSLAVLWVYTGDTSATPVEESAEAAPERVAAIGRVAGRAADQIEADADADNAVYGAWKQMTDLLEVPNPAASTPAEFAAAAVAAGMAAEDVTELTELFESVRYGTADPTADRESRAVEAFRRIETTYAGDEP